ncbi:glycosyltransferase family 32 protein [Pedobacter nyackensis]|uniref:glycosyltransferase family 32 protein n=1 Tax=Pedobacter nyackensis TaxID=475255 RepID=UPI0029302E97|nr:glycosyltransferase [Pedobacter nyackensis]
MSIPKTIYQTFKSDKLPLITRWYISRFRKRNQDYTYEFYNDERIESFLSTAYGDETLKLYQRLNIGAAKADFFRYAILLKKGGVYLDIDSSINGSLQDFILPNDVAIISDEGNSGLCVQWALVFEANHPFLQKTMELMADNIRNNRFPHNVHAMTGPTVYSEAIKLCLIENPDIPYRKLGVDYNKHFKFKYPLSKLLYQSGTHWKKQQLTQPVLKNGSIA